MARVNMGILGISIYFILSIKVSSWFKRLSDCEFSLAWDWWILWQEVRSMKLRLLSGCGDQGIRWWSRSPLLWYREEPLPHTRVCTHTHTHVHAHTHTHTQVSLSVMQTGATVTTLRWPLTHPPVVQSLSRVWLCNLMDCSTPGFPVPHLLPELTQTHVRWVSWCYATLSSSVSPFFSYCLLYAIEINPIQTCNFKKIL